MMTDIVPIDSGPWQAVELNATGLTFTRDVSFEEWEQIGGRLQFMGKAIQFWIGDWIRYGEAHYGEKYAQAIEAKSARRRNLPRKSLVTAMRRDIVAAIAKTDRAIKRHCTGDPNTCRHSYDVAAAPEIPLCGIIGGECDRGQYRDELLAKRR